MAVSGCEAGTKNEEGGGKKIGEKFYCQPCGTWKDSPGGKVKGLRQRIVGRQISAMHRGNKNIPCTLVNLQADSEYFKNSSLAEAIDSGGKSNCSMLRMY